MNAGLKFHYNLKASNILFKYYQYRLKILTFNTLNDRNYVDCRKIIIF